MRHIILDGPELSLEEYFDFFEEELKKIEEQEALENKKKSISDSGQ